MSLKNNYDCFFSILSEKAARGADLTLTENGALTHRSSGSVLVDLQARVTELRYAPAEEIYAAARLAFSEDPLLALKLFFQIGDVRGGRGERAIFNSCMDFLVSEHPSVALELLSLIPEYTRWDHLVRLTVSGNKEVSERATGLVLEQFQKDLAEVRSAKEGEAAHISLLGKWLPSLQTKKAQEKAIVRHLLKALKLQEREYRHALSKLREHLHVIEKYMSAKEYDSIDMETLTAKQQLRYSAFFRKAMAEKRHAYIQAVLRGETKMNASVLNPLDICHDYLRLNGLNEDYEALWSLLPDRTCGNGNTLVVRDGSYSMTSRLGQGSSATMLEAATAMALYCAERLSGPFRDHFITFSNCPELISLENCKSLAERLHLMKLCDDCSNTDIEATFDLILDCAVSGNLRQEELPAYLLILSDMEFDEARSEYGVKVLSRQTLFETIRKKWDLAGYRVPTLVFWNLNGHRTTFPEIDSENGVIYLSGFSTSELTMVMAGEFERLCEITEQETVVDKETGEEKVITRTTVQKEIASPLEQLTLKLSKKRYDAVETAAKLGLRKEGIAC